MLWVSEQLSGFMAPSGTKPRVELPDKIQGILLNMNFLINYKYKTAFNISVFEVHTCMYVIYIHTNIYTYIFPGLSKILTTHLYFIC